MSKRRKQLRKKRRAYAKRVKLRILSGEGSGPSRVEVTKRDRIFDQLRNPPVRPTRRRDSYDWW